KEKRSKSIHRGEPEGSAKLNRMELITS
ncbi:MAG: hypothetical protein ACI976_003019, partial [Aureispira sp.]